MTFREIVFRFFKLTTSQKYELEKKFEYLGYDKPSNDVNRQKNMLNKINDMNLLTELDKEMLIYECKSKI